MNKEKLYIGINLGFNASAALVSNQRGVLAAISEERLNGIKNTKQIPIDAVVKCCEMYGHANDIVIHKVCFSHYQTLTMSEVERTVSNKDRKVFDLYKSKEYSPERMIVKMIEARGISVENNYGMTRVEHHLAHAIASIGIYGVNDEDKFFITSDGFGDGISARVMFEKGNGKGIRLPLSEVELPESMALLYQFVTGALGFTMHKHEGKITGLAAYGYPRYLEEFYELYENRRSTESYELRSELKFNETNKYIKDFDLRSGLDSHDKECYSRSKQTIIDFDLFLKLKYSVFNMVNELIEKGATREDIASTVQVFTEVETGEWIIRTLKRTGNLEKAKSTKCYLSGGLFANVKINQRLKDLNIFKEVLVCPAMGDEGTSVGSAISTAMLDGEYQDLVGKKDAHEYIPGVYSGTNIYRNISGIFEECRKHKDVVAHIYENREELLDEVTDRLAEKKIVCLCRGWMEFGPRALCHRSILYDCTDKTVNDWLNKQLGRTEFMPFAPVCLEKNADDLFYNLEGGETTSQYMTMTFDCKDEFKENYPAACHIDGTARPQIIKPGTDLFLEKMFNLYQVKTGKKVLINTSFNLHNYPIIEDPLVALSSWLVSNTDVLVIGNIIIERIK